MASDSEKIRGTVAHLRMLQSARAEGFLVSYTTDPAWLVNIAINRRGGWPDDPSHHRGSCMPVNGRYPKRAEGIRFNHLRNLARNINRPRLIVREGELGEHRWLVQRLPHRFTAE